MFFNFNKGQSNGSLMDKGLSQSGLSGAFTKQLAAFSKTKHAFKDGGPVDPVEEEILQLEMIAGLTSSNSYEAFLIELAKDRLSYLYELQKNKK
jgi:hypothetical protein